MSIVVEPFIYQTLADAEPVAATNARTHINRQLRAAAERLLWNHLRERRFGGYTFRRQYLIDTWLADFACLEARLILEIRSQVPPALAAHSEARRTALQSLGFKVLQLRDRDVLIETRIVLDMLQTAIGDELKRPAIRGNSFVRDDGATTRESPKLSLEVVERAVLFRRLSTRHDAMDGG